MDYYINARNGKKKKVKKIVLYIFAYLAVFGVSFFISFKLVASTQSGTDEIRALKGEISALNSQLAQREERISSLEMQLESVQRLLENERKGIGETDSEEENEPEDNIGKESDDEKE